jgi:disulfide bond formation protein DsbB
MQRAIRYLPGLVATGQLLTVCGVLLGSLSFQFFAGELPCPLCVIQRLCFLLALAGGIGVLRGAGSPLTGFAFTILAGLLGALASTRQILLHIVPPNTGYGPPVMGMHLYTWALIVFFCLIASSAIGILGCGGPVEKLPRWLTLPLCTLCVVIGITIALATFAMEGFTFLIPDDPVRYELFHRSS